jgi:hypothetical protein
MDEIQLNIEAAQAKTLRLLTTTNVYIPSGVRDELAQIYADQVAALTFLRDARRAAYRPGGTGDYPRQTARAAPVAGAGVGDHNGITAGFPEAVREWSKAMCVCDPDRAALMAEAQAWQRSAVRAAEAGNSEVAFISRLRAGEFRRAADMIEESAK